MGYLKYIFKRLVSLIFVLLGVTFIVFMIMSLAPGDPARVILGYFATPEAVETLREEMGLNAPVLVQYGKYMMNALRGDLGVSYRTNLPVLTEILSRFPNTLYLTLTAVFVSTILAIPLGIIAAVKQNTIFDSSSMVLALIGISMPTFWLGILLILLFALQLGWLPSFGADELRSIILPALTLALVNMASIARTTRSATLEVIRQDYIRTARAKGLSYNVVIRRHAVKNAMIPTMTMIGLIIGFLLGGAIVVETVFAWPGVGRLLIQSIGALDTPMVLGCIILFSASFSIVNLIVDLLYGLVNPRIRSQYT